jgi:NH3-dependent NAD+ synthetase
MSIETLSNEEKAKIKQLIDNGLKVLQEVDDLKGGLKDTVKAIAEELDIKPAILNKAISAAFKANIDAAKEEVDDVEEILVVAGRR